MTLFSQCRNVTMIAVWMGAFSLEGAVFEEVNGLVAVEAEHFVSTDKTETRDWILMDENTENTDPSDPDPKHHQSASGKAYLEILPDLRVTHGQPTSGALYQYGGENCIVNYHIYFNTTGTYNVWVRGYTTGAEDNSLHVGIDGTWPESGRGIHWVNNTGEWVWTSSQRNPGDEYPMNHRIFLEVTTGGVHTISFSMREDGFEFDKFVLTAKRKSSPSGTGPDERVYEGKVGTVSPSVGRKNGFAKYPHTATTAWDIRGRRVQFPNSNKPSPAFPVSGSGVLVSRDTEKGPLRILLIR